MKSLALLGAASLLVPAGYALVPPGKRADSAQLVEKDVQGRDLPNDGWWNHRSGHHRHTVTLPDTRPGERPSSGLGSFTGLPAVSSLSTSVSDPAVSANSSAALTTLVSDATVTVDLTSTFTASLLPTSVRLNSTLSVSRTSIVYPSPTSIATDNTTARSVDPLTASFTGYRNSTSSVCLITVTTQTTISTVTVIVTAGESLTSSSGVPSSQFSSAAPVSLTLSSSQFSSAAPVSLTLSSSPSASVNDSASGTTQISVAPLTASLSSSSSRFLNSSRPSPTAPVSPSYSQPIIIDTTKAPFSAVSMTSSFSAVVPVTATATGSSVPTGTPDLGTVHCGVHGKPNGNWRLAEYIYNNGHEPVTMQGCYQFCRYSRDFDNGCMSYAFYKNELGAPRCGLYGSRAAYAMESVDNRQPETWYDLECGEPLAPQSGTKRHVVQGGKPGDLTALRWE